MFSSAVSLSAYISAHDLSEPVAKVGPVAIIPPYSPTVNGTVPKSLSYKSIILKVLGKSLQEGLSLLPPLFFFFPL